MLGALSTRQSHTAHPATPLRLPAVLLVGAPEFVYAALLCVTAVPRCCAMLRSRMNCHVRIESGCERERVALIGIRMSAEWLCAAALWLQPAQPVAVAVPPFAVRACAHCAKPPSASSARVVCDAPVYVCEGCEG